MNGIVGFTLTSLICWFSVCATGTCYVVKICTVLLGILNITGKGERLAL